MNLDLIRQTWADAPANFAELFYADLFGYKPELRSMFPADLTEQQRKLTVTITAAIKLAENPEKLVPVLQELGRKHKGYGVTSDMYAAVGASLLDTLAVYVVPFTQEAEASWEELLGFVSSVMENA